MKALKYRKPYMEAQIHVGYVDKLTETVIYVRDNGIGISKENQERIFEQFFQTKKKKQEGQGIGLYNCKEMVENWGGQFWVESQITKGSSFFFSVPKEIENIEKVPTI